MTPRGTFLRSGKVKDIYELDADHLLFYFTDRVSAFDVVLPSTIPRKGEVLCKLSAFWFESLGVPNHMVSTEGPNMMVVQKMTMIPVECVVRGYLYGSLYDRLLKGEVSLPVDKVLAAKLPAPYFDPTTKSEVKDEPITEAEIVREGRMSASEMERGEGLDRLDLRQDEPEGPGLGLHTRRPEAGIREEGRQGAAGRLDRAGRVQDVALREVRSRQVPGQLRQAACP